MMKALLHLRKAFGHSMKGLRETFRNEMAFRIELTAAVILIPTALILSVSPIVRIMLIGSVFLVLIVELINTGIEYVVNRILQNNIIYPEWRKMPEVPRFLLPL